MLHSRHEAVVETREHGVHGRLEGIEVLGASHGAARGGQGRCRGEVGVDVGVKHDGRLVLGGHGRAGGGHDGAVVVESSRGVVHGTGRGVHGHLALVLLLGAGEERVCHHGVVHYGCHGCQSLPIHLHFTSW